MTIDADKLADIAIDAAFDDYEGSGIFTKDRAKAAARKAVKAAMKPGYGGYGVGAYAMTPFPPAGHVAYHGQPGSYMGEPGTCFEPPLLPDVD